MSANPGGRGIEAYVRTVDAAAVVATIESATRPLSADAGDAAPSPPHLRRGTLSLLVRPSEDGFLSVWLRGPAPWPDSPALARYLAARLPFAVRCDPGAAAPGVSPYSDVFLHIEDGRERFVTWA